MATQKVGTHSELAGMHKTHVQEELKLGHYGKFAVMVGLSFITMYILMYAMVNSLSNVFNSINQFYMAGIMATPMAVIELLMMNEMYPNRKLNSIILGGSILAFALFWMGIRSQVGVGDQQFLRSMIPHHAGAILMCKEARVSNPAIVDLCKNILSSQQSEIDQMKSMLNN